MMQRRPGGNFACCVFDVYTPECLVLELAIAIVIWLVEPGDPSDPITLQPYRLGPVGEYEPSALRKTASAPACQAGVTVETDQGFRNRWREARSRLPGLSK
jgi:hypothetical protein